MPRKLDELLAPPSSDAKPGDPQPAPPKSAPKKEPQKTDDVNKTLREARAKRKEKPHDDKKPVRKDGGGADLLRPSTWKHGFFK